MTRAQVNKRAMHGKVKQVLDTNQTIISSKPALVNAVERFNTQYTSIGESAPNASILTSGATTGKNQLKVKLANLIYALAGEGIAYATKNNLQQLKANLKFKISELKSENDEMLIDHAKLVVNLLTPELPQMQDYDIDQSQIDSLTKAWKDFSAGIKDKTGTLSTRIVAKDSIAKQFSIINQLLRDELDTMMRKFKTTSPEFYKAYIQARKTDDLGGSTKKPDGTTAPKV